MTDPKPESNASAPARDAERRQATFLQIAGAVFWSFFGVRKGRNMLEDEATIKPQHVIAVAILFALVFVLALIALVRIIIAHAA